MDAQRAALDVAARNVAAAEAAGPNGEYARMEPIFRIDQTDDDEPRVEFTGTRLEHGTNVDILTEMIAVMNASRAYESDASDFRRGQTSCRKDYRPGAPMRVEPLVPDLPPAASGRADDAVGFARAIDALGSVLSDASSAEDAFAYGRGTLQEAIYERAQADVALSVATSGAQRLTQAVQSVLNMQV